MIDRLYKKVRIFNLIFFMLLLAGCATVKRHISTADGAPDFNVDVSKIPDAVPKVEPLSKYGNPSSYIVNGERYHVMKSSLGYDATGIASWYGTKFYKKRTSSGEPYNMLAMTAASKVLPLPTYAQVTNLSNNKKIIVKINDRGPFHENRIIDLSFVAAKKLGVFPKGTALVEVKAIDPRNPAETLSDTTPPMGLGHPQIYLQLGAFSIETNADTLKNKVAQLTPLPVIIKTGYKNSAPVYRVQIGPIPDVDNTDALHATLQRTGLGEPITVIQ